MNAFKDLENSFQKSKKIIVPNVGIGTSTPARLLQVNGPMRMTAAALPGTPGTGDVAIDSGDSNKLKWYDGSTWQNAGGSGVATSVSASAGTAGSPSVSFSGDTDTGLYSAAANTIGVATGGSNIFNFSSAGIVAATTGGGVMTTANGTAAAPTFSFAGDTGTGWWRPATSTIAVSTGGTERMRVDSSGNVGIGTNGPSAPLHISTDPSVSATAVKVFSTNLASAMSATGIYSEVANANFVSPSGLYVAVDGTSDNTVITTTMNQSIGLRGTSYQTSASAKITDARGVYGRVWALNSNANLITNGYAGYFDLSGAGANSITNGYGVYVGSITGATNKYSVYASDSTAPSYFAGSVGVGTTSPIATLDVIGTGGIQYQRNGSQTVLKMTDYAGGSPMVYLSGADNTVGTYLNSRGPFNIYTGNSDPSVSTLGLTVSGANVGIGTTSPQTTLQVAGVISPATNNTYTLGNATYRFTEVYATNGVINTSDRREKKDIYNTDLGLDFINKLRPVSYRWNTGVDNDVHYGLIAQEAEQVIAEVGKTEKTSIVTHDETTDRYGVRYSELISPLIKAVQELYNRLMGVESDVTALKAKDAVKDREIASVKADNESKAKEIAELKAKAQKAEQENAAMKARLDKIEKALKSK